MSLQSMTGFARTSGDIAAGAASGKWAWELRSVNARGFDIRLRLPAGFEELERLARDLAAKAFSRGHVQASLNFESGDQQAIPVLNRDVLRAVAAAAQEVRTFVDAPIQSAESLLSVRGVLEYGGREASGEEIGQRNKELASGLQRAVDMLAEARRTEGEALRGVLIGQLDAMEDLTARIDADPSHAAHAVQERLQTQMAALLEDPSGLDRDRLHQEVAILATKVDISEETDRLKTHLTTIRAMLEKGGPVGRKLDFLAQELNREANTICSKSASTSVTTAGVDLKVEIDRFREQVQNVE